VGSIALGTVLRFLAYRRWVFLDPSHAAVAAGPGVSLDRAA
jgi:hypothetical protein